MTTGTPPNILEMSDEDFANMAPPSSDGGAPASEEQQQEAETPTETQEEPQQIETPVVEQEAEIQEEKTPEEKPVETKTETEKPADGEVQPEEKEKPKTEETSEPDYKAFYTEIMKPFKANGKTIELRDPAEAVKLMQMGANYTRKMQDLQPHRKVLTMLENNGLLDEGKLSFLIDLEQKNPEAIKKLIKDSGIDPLEIDTETEPAYVGGSHVVDDKEVNFRTVVEDLRSSEAGQETLQVITQHWDQAAKQAAYENPDLINVIHQQREAGIYDLIDAEITRRKTLGTLPSNVSYLTAYETVGNALHASGAFAEIEAKQQQTPAPKKEPLEVKPAAPKPVVDNGDKANAASPSRSTPKAAEPVVNYLAMSDEDFLKITR